MRIVTGTKVPRSTARYAANETSRYGHRGNRLPWDKYDQMRIGFVIEANIGTDED